MSAEVWWVITTLVTLNANKSKIKNPNLIYPGWVLVIP